MFKFETKINNMLFVILFPVKIKIITMMLIIIIIISQTHFLIFIFINTWFKNNFWYYHYVRTWSSCEYFFQKKKCVILPLHWWINTCKRKAHTNTKVLVFIMNCFVMYQFFRKGDTLTSTSIWQCVLLNSQCLNNSSFLQFLCFIQI